MHKNEHVVLCGSDIDVNIMLTIILAVAFYIVYMAHQTDLFRILTCRLHVHFVYLKYWRYKVEARFVSVLVLEQGAAEEVPHGIYAVFSATAWNFNVIFYTLIKTTYRY